MGHHYSRQGSGGTGMLLRFLGFIFAMILVIGMLDKAGLKVSLEGQEGKSPGPRYNEASVGDGREGRAGDASHALVPGE